MPGLYRETLSKLERIKESHPNTYKIWKFFLEKKKQRMIHLLNQCNTMVNNINDISDVDPMVMLLLYHISVQAT